MGDQVLYFEDVSEGDTAPALARVLTRTDLVTYAGASGDYNPLHHDEAFDDDVGHVPRQVVRLAWDRAVRIPERREHQVPLDEELHLSRVSTRNRDEGDCGRGEAGNQDADRQAPMSARRALRERPRCASPATCASAKSTGRSSRRPMPRASRTP